MTFSLRAFGATPTAQAPLRTAERMTPRGLVLWTIAVDPDASPRDRVHWRLADGRKPPLDIALNRTTGAFQELTFFIQDETIPRAAQRLPALGQRDGLPQFDTALWPSGRYDVDEPGSAQFALDGRDLYVMFSPLDAAAPSAAAPVGAIAAGSLRFLVDQEERVVGLALPHLSDDEMTTLRDADVLAPMETK